MEMILGAPLSMNLIGTCKFIDSLIQTGLVSPVHPVQEKTTLWVHPLKNDNVGSAQQTLWVQNGGK